VLYDSVRRRWLHDTDGEEDYGDGEFVHCNAGPIHALTQEPTP
jgi:hypothetical protein